MSNKPKPISLNELKATVPHSVDNEKALLSSMMQSKDVATEMFGKLQPEDFFIPAHKIIFERMLKDWKKSLTFDLIAFTERLIDDKILLEIGGPSEITVIYNLVPTASNYKQYLEGVLEKSLARKVLKLCFGSADEIVKKPDEVKRILIELQNESREIRPYEDKPAKSLKDDVLDKITRMEHGTPDEETVKTGIIRLDQDSPIKKGDFPMITGETKAGKSIFALSILENVCIKNGLSGLYFSLESPRSEVIDRMFAGVSRIPMDKHHVKFLNEHEITRAMKAAEAIGRSNLIVHDDKFELLDIISTIRQTHMHNPNLGIVVVDYCQLVVPPSKKGGTRQEEVASISRTLRLLALELQVPIIMLSQENEDGKSRESRALMQDCTAWWQIINDGVALDVREIKIPLQRNGQSGIHFDITFLGAIARVENYVESTENEQEKTE